MRSEHIILPLGDVDVSIRQGELAFGDRVMPGISLDYQFPVGVQTLHPMSITLAFSNEIALDKLIGSLEALRAPMRHRQLPPVFEVLEG